jgi:hypothetical protein
MECTDISRVIRRLLSVLQCGVDCASGLLMIMLENRVIERRVLEHNVQCNENEVFV